MKELQDYKITPRRLIIDLIRIKGNEPTQVKTLIAAGDIFAFKASAMRVTITRLVREGLLESDDRGIYRLADTTSPLTRFVNAWREGENRIKRWDGTWISTHLPKNPNRNDRKRSLRALDFMGFREGMDGIWVRPNNLATSVKAVKNTLGSLRLEKSAQVFRISDCNEVLQQQWQKSLWPIDRYQSNYESALGNLEKSREKVSRLSTEEALLETFITGSKAIHILAIDPLLPEEIMPTAKRRMLWQAMLQYDHFGRTFWENFPPDRSETHATEQPRLRSVK